MIRLETIIPAPPTPISDPPFRFELSNSSSIINYDVLQENYFDFHKVLMDYLLTPTSIGYKFTPIDQLDRMMGNNPNWMWIQATISDGTEYHTTPTEDKTRIMDLHHRLSKGNHKSASGKRAMILNTKLSKEVEKWWCIPILPNHALEIPNLEIALLGLSHKACINKRG